MYARIMASREPEIVIEGDDLRRLAEEIETVIGIPMLGLRRAKCVTITRLPNGRRKWSYDNGEELLEVYQD